MSPGPRLPPADDLLRELALPERPRRRLQVDLRAGANSAETVEVRQMKSLKVISYKCIVHSDTSRARILIVPFTENGIKGSVI